MSRKRKPPIGLQNFFSAMVLGGVLGLIVGMILYRLGVEIASVALPWLPIDIPAGQLTPLAFAVVGAFFAGMLLYKWEKFRFFIG